MASSYDYNEIQPGASDIDREAWPVMYDPYSDDQGLQEVSTKDSESIDFSGKGTSNDKLKADVKISKQSGNALRLTSDGLFVADSAPILSISGSEFIDVSTDEPQRPVISLKKSEDESNDLVDDNGLYVHVPVKDIQGSDSVNVSKNGDTWGVDIVLDPNQGNVVLSTDNGLKAEIASGTIPEVQGSTTVSADKEGNVYTLDTILSSKVDNILKKESDGLYVPDAVIPDSFIDSVSSTDTVDLDVDANKNLTAEAKISEESGNKLEKKADGLYVEEDYIQGISDSDSVVLSVDGHTLTASAVPSALDGKVAITISNAGGNVTFEGNGTDGNPLSATVDIPEEFITGLDNTGHDVILAVDGNGNLSAEIASGTIPEIQGSTSVDVQTSGVTNTISAKISSEQDNQLEIKSDGLYVKPTEIPDVPVKSLNEGDGIIITEDEEHPGNFTISATTQVQNISAFNGIEATNDVEGTWTFQADISEATGNRLELDQEDNGLYVGPELPQDGSVGQVLKKTADGTEWDDEQEQYVTGVQNTDTVTLAVELGQLSATANISSAAGNILEDRGGLYVPNTVIPQEFITSVANTPSIELNVDQNGQLTSDLKIDTTNEGNVHLAITQDGLVASADIPVDYINNVVETDTVILAVDNGDLSATAKVSSKGDNQTDPANALEIEQDGLWSPTLYLGHCESSARPSDAITGQYIFDTDLGYCLYRHGGAWVNSTGAIIEGNVEPSGSAVDWIANPMTSYGDLIVGGPSGVPQNLIPGTDGQVLTIASGVPSWLNVPAQNGDHKTIVDSNDLNPDYLANKFTAGDNITIVNNGSSLEFSAPSIPNDIHVDYNASVTWATDKQTMSDNQTFIYRTLATGNIVPTAILIPCDHQYANTTYKAFISLTESYTTANVLYSGSVTVTNPPSTPPRTARIPLTPQNGTTHIPVNTLYSVCFGKSSGGTTECFKVVFSGTIINCRTYAGAITETPNFQWNSASTQNWTPCVGVEYKMYRS